jgi:hypothetical protein
VTKKTIACDGINPEWNENISIRYVAKDFEKGFNPKELARNTGILSFSLFDQIDHFDENQDNLVYSNERKFLGSFTIPLINIFMNSTQEAMYLVKRPLTLFGYQILKNPDDLYNPEFKDFNEETMEDPLKPSYINV